MLLLFWCLHLLSFHHCTKFLLLLWCRHLFTFHHLFQFLHCVWLISLFTQYLLMCSAPFNILLVLLIILLEQQRLRMISLLNFVFSCSATCPSYSSLAQKLAKHFTQPAPKTGKHKLPVPTNHNGFAYSSQMTVPIIIITQSLHKKISKMKLWRITASMLCPLSLPRNKAQAVSPSYAQSKAQMNLP